MPRTLTEKLAASVRRDLERHFRGRNRLLRRNLEALLRMLITASVPPSLEDLACEVRGLRSHLAALERHLRNDPGLPAALFARYRYRQPEPQARRRHEVTDGEWRLVHDLAREVGRNLEVLVPALDGVRHRWHDRLEEEFSRVEVMLYEEALTDMLVCALEGYLSPRRSRRKGYEVYGINLGMVREVRQLQRHRGMMTTYYVAVMRSQPQLSAEGSFGEVLPNERSLQAVLDATRTLFPQYQVVGDFHSHCYDTLETLLARRGWEYSRGDEASSVETFDQMLGAGERPLVTFIVALARCARRVHPGRHRGLKNTYRLNIGGCRVVLGAYRVLGSGRYSRRNITLGITGSPDT